MNEPDKAQSKYGTHSSHTPPQEVSQIRVPSAESYSDFATIFGFALTFIFIAATIYIGQSNASFFNLPAMLLVILGTITVTAISYTASELKKSGHIISNTIFYKRYEHKDLAIALMDISVLARKKGLLPLNQAKEEIKNNPYLNYVLQMAVDGYQPEDIERAVKQEIEAVVDHNKRSASITRRASEVAPAMGLIGTLVGLVQMLAELENPESIGPAMAIALLTTFYGAILGTVIMGPLAIKLEKNSKDEIMTKTLIMIGIVSIARQENPRRLEILLNSELPLDEKINYFNEQT